MAYVPALPAAEPPVPQQAVPPIQLPVPTVQPPVPPVQAIQAAHIPQFDFSHFKPEFAGKLDEDVEAHLLRMNDWMDTHAFQKGVKVQCICLTLVGEARLLYESLRPITIDWIGLQNQCWQQYSKIGNTREVISCMEIILFQQKHRNISYICHMHKTGSYIIMLWRTTGISSVQKYNFYRIILGTFLYRIFKKSSRNS